MRSSASAAGTSWRSNQRRTRGVYSSAKRFQSRALRVNAQAFEQADGGLRHVRPTILLSCCMALLLSRGGRSKWAGRRTKSDVGPLVGPRYVFERRNLMNAGVRHGARTRLYLFRTIHDKDWGRSVLGTPHMPRSNTPGSSSVTNSEAHRPPRGSATQDKPDSDRLDAVA